MKKKQNQSNFFHQLPQCVIDAVYSIGVKYSSTRKTVIRYCEKNGIKRLSTPPGCCSETHTINQLIANIAPHIHDDFGASSLFENSQKTSTKNRILKAEAVYRFAKVLADNGIQTMADIRSASYKTIDHIESEIKKIPGQKSGISFSYFLMLSGDNRHMKIDRWLLRFVGEALGENNFSNVSQAHTDLLAVCAELRKTYPQLTPRLLDHTIWSHMKQ